MCWLPTPCVETQNKYFVINNVLRPIRIPLDQFAYP